MFTALVSRFALIGLVFAIGLLFLRAGGSSDATARMGSLINGLTPVADVASVALLAVLIYPQGRRLRDLVGSRRAAGLPPSIGREIGAILLTTVVIAVAFFACSFLTTFLAGLVFGALNLKQRRLVVLIVAHIVLDAVGFSVPAAMMLS